jgi:hypothetical protein
MMPNIRSIFLRGLFIGLIAMLCACSPDALVSDAKPDGFAADKMIDSLAQSLAQNSATLQKRILQFTQDSQEALQEESRTATPDQQQWKKELVFFRQADLSTPQKQELYLLQKNADSLAFQAIATKTPIQKIVIAYFPDGSIRQLSIEKDEQNLLYSIRQSLKLEFDKQHLQTYEIVGEEKSLGSPTRFYSIKGQIAYPKR